jgi:hypothetical protein
MSVRVVAGLVALLLLTSCGGADSFATQADAVCAKHGKRIAAIGSRFEARIESPAVPVTSKWLVSFDVALRAEFQALLRDLRALRPPPAERDAAAKWLAAQQEGVDQFSAQIALAPEFDKAMAALARAKNLPEPKLPPGTGPTATEIARLYEVPAMRRYLRRVAEQARRSAATAQRATRLARGLGLRTCAGLGPPKSAS